MTQADIQKFYELETALHKKEFRNSSEKVATLIADDFLEFGKSGGTYNKEAIIAELSNEAVDLQITVTNFTAKALAESVVLVTYIATMLDEDTATLVATNRSSIWVLRNQNWQMVFHQGTKISVE